MEYKQHKRIFNTELHKLYQKHFVRGVRYKRCSFSFLNFYENQRRWRAFIKKYQLGKLKLLFKCSPSSIIFGDNLGNSPTLFNRAHLAQCPVQECQAPFINVFSKMFKWNIIANCEQKVLGYYLVSIILSIISKFIIAAFT